MVLEPWITPSLFYQFLGKDKDNTAMDTYTFCQILGPDEANRQLRIHWDTWLTEDYISAEKYLKNALLIMPEDPIVNDHYGDVLWKLNMKLQMKDGNMRLDFLAKVNLCKCKFRISLIQV